MRTMLVEMTPLESGVQRVPRTCVALFTANRSTPVGDTPLTSGHVRMRPVLTFASISVPIAYHHSCSLFKPGCLFGHLQHSTEDHSLLDVNIALHLPENVSPSSYKPLCKTYCMHLSGFKLCTDPHSSPGQIHKLSKGYASGKQRRDLKYIEYRANGNIFGRRWAITMQHTEE